MTYTHQDHKHVIPCSIFMHAHTFSETGLWVQGLLRLQLDRLRPFSRGSDIHRAPFWGTEDSIYRQLLHGNPRSHTIRQKKANTCRRLVFTEPHVQIALTVILNLMQFQIIQKYLRAGGFKITDLIDLIDFLICSQAWRQRSLALQCNLSVSCGYIWCAFIPSSCMFFVSQGALIFSSKLVILSSNVKCLEYFHVQCKLQPLTSHPPLPKKWLLLDNSNTFGLAWFRSHEPTPLSAIPWLTWKHRLEVHSVKQWSSFGPPVSLKRGSRISVN